MAISSGKVDTHDEISWFYRGSIAASPGRVWWRRYKFDVWAATAKRKYEVRLSGVRINESSASTYRNAK
jgi:hypothetical protein